MKNNKLNKIIKSICAVVDVATSGLLIWTKFSEKKRKKDEDLSKDTYVGAGVPVQTVRKTFYEKYMKRFIDIVISIMGIIVLSPVFIVTAVAIFITDPGPVIFTQKRVGINKTFFKLYKFRSMKMSTPHDVPTHMLDNPESYITTVGKFIRKTSIDELPQLFNILEGNLSVVGPRPALWNQEDLVAERDKYCANDVMPGLTGWAQINGRDELEIPVKAKMDGEYVERLRKNIFSGIVIDTKCFFGTITSVLKSDGVVEGGTGEMKKNARYDIPDVNTRIGFGEDVSVDLSQKKKVLITGANSYIGESFEKYAKEHYTANFEIDTVDMIDGSWREKDFSDYDTVFHVAGIAHADVGKVSEEVKDKYYAVNTDLAIETAEKAKKEGVKQFVFMSSMIVYGESAPYGKEKIITADTKPEPSNFYGDSKWQADKGVRALATDDFNVLVLRPPMIYGKGSKGNYPTLAKLAKKLPVFPNVNNQRSMLYIENLCEFLCQVMIVGKGGVFFPQNAEYTRTADMVKFISEATGKRIFLMNALNPFVWLGSKVPGKIGGLVNKAFGSCCYQMSDSLYNNLDYSIVSNYQSILRAEKAFSQECENKRALMLASVASMIDLFNMDNIDLLEELGFDVDVACNFEEGSITSQKRVKQFREELDRKGIVTYHLPIPRSVWKIKQIISSYKKTKELVDNNDYHIVHCHSPIGGVVCRLACRDSRKKGTKVVYTAHGFHFYNGASKKNWLIYYPIEKLCSRLTDVIITINREDFERAKKFYSKRVEYVPGIGVHTKKIEQTKVDKKEKRSSLGLRDDDFVVMSTGQLSTRKNHEVIIKAIAQINNPKVKYMIVGFGELEEYLKKLAVDLDVSDRVIFTGYRDDVYELLQIVDAFAFPSLQEGLPVSLMEAMAAGLPIVASNIRGNTDLVDVGYGGFLCESNSSEQFRHAIVQLVHLLDEKGEAIKEYNINKMKDFDCNIVMEKMRLIYLESES